MKINDKWLTHIWKKMLKFDKMKHKQVLDLTREGLEGLKTIGAANIDTLLM